MDCSVIADNLQRLSLKFTADIAGFFAGAQSHKPAEAEAPASVAYLCLCVDIEELPGPDLL